MVKRLDVHDDVFADLKTSKEKMEKTIGHRIPWSKFLDYLLISSGWKGVLEKEEK